MGAKKWTYEACYEEAKKCKTKIEFRQNNYGAYLASYRQGWINDYDWFVYLRKPNGYWTKERCYEEALKYKTKIEFCKENVGAYTSALKNGWIEEYTWFKNGHELEGKKRKMWTYEACYEVALTCKTKNEMRKKNHVAYVVAYKHDWFKYYDWFENGHELEGKKRKMWFYETCKEAALKCETLKEFYTNFVGAYNTSRRYGWIDEYDWLNKGKNVFKDKIDYVYAYFFSDLNSVYIGRTIEPHKRDTKHQTEATSAVYRFAQENNMAIPEMTILESGLTVEEGLEREDYYVKKYREEGWNVLNKAKTGKRSGAIGAIGKGKWNYQTCYEEALKYKTRGEFKKNSPSAYIRARKQDWLDIYTWFDPPKTVVKWTEETCYEEALKYDNIKDFRALSSSAYAISLKNGWRKQYTWLKSKRRA